MGAENSRDLDQECQRNKKQSYDDGGDDDGDDLHKGDFACQMNTKGFVVAAAHSDPFLNEGSSNTPGDESQYSEDTSWQASKVHEPHRRSISSRSATEQTDTLVL